MQMQSGRGVQVIADFISAEQCQTVLAAVEQYRGEHEIPLIVREEPKRSLRYRVIDGDAIVKHLPVIQALYERTLPVMRKMMDEDVVPLHSHKVGLNVNLTPPGGAYRWHYDRNAVTAVLYLNTVEGGEIEVYPDYRFLLSGSRSSRLQALIDKLMQTELFLKMFGKKQSIAPQPGLLVAMGGDRCLHSVTTVCGSAERICIVMSFDSEDATFPQARALDSYLYSTQAAGQSKRDPNYSQ